MELRKKHKPTQVHISMVPARSILLLMFDLEANRFGAIVASMASHTREFVVQIFLVVSNTARQGILVGIALVQN